MAQHCPLVFVAPQVVMVVHANWCHRWRGLCRKMGTSCMACGMGGWSSCCLLHPVPRWVRHWRCCHGCRPAAQPPNNGEQATRVGQLTWHNCSQPTAQRGQLRQVSARWGVAYWGAADERGCQHSKRPGHSEAPITGSSAELQRAAAHGGRPTQAAGAVVRPSRASGVCDQGGKITLLPFPRGPSPAA